jgi:3-hydroxyacyl-CoA dehydrogenase
MFVFKAAVVGAGTMGGEIAQVIAASEVPVVLKDMDHSSTPGWRRPAR